MNFMRLIVWQLEMDRTDGTNVVTNATLFAQIIQDYGNVPHHTDDFRRA
jgi:hypothetical protein